MPGPVTTSSIVPFGADRTIYLVVDRFGARGAVCGESEIECPELETVLSDLMAGRFLDPIRVIAFNTLEHWSKDISVDVADEILCRCDTAGVGPPQYLASFMEAHLSPAGQPTGRRA